MPRRLVRYLSGHHLGFAPHGIHGAIIAYQSNGDEDTFKLAAFLSQECLWNQERFWNQDGFWDVFGMFLETRLFAEMGESMDDHLHHYEMHPICSLQRHDRSHRPCAAKMMDSLRTSSNLEWVLGEKNRLVGTAMCVVTASPWQLAAAGLLCGVGYRFTMALTIRLHAFH